MKESKTGTHSELVDKFVTYGMGIAKDVDRGHLRFGNTAQSSLALGALKTVGYGVFKSFNIGSERYVKYCSSLTSALTQGADVLGMGFEFTVYRRQGSRRVDKVLRETRPDAIEAKAAVYRDHYEITTHHLGDVIPDSRLEIRESPYRISGGTRFIIDQELVDGLDIFDPRIADRQEVESVRPALLTFLDASARIEDETGLLTDITGKRNIVISGGGLSLVDFGLRDPTLFTAQNRQEYNHAHNRLARLAA